MMNANFTPLPPFALSASVDVSHVYDCASLSLSLLAMHNGLLICRSAVFGFVQSRCAWGAHAMDVFAVLSPSPLTASPACCSLCCFACCYLSDLVVPFFASSSSYVFLLALWACACLLCFALPLLKCLISDIFCDWIHSLHLMISGDLWCHCQCLPPCCTC